MKGRPLRTRKDDNAANREVIDRWHRLQAAAAAGHLSPEAAAYIRNAR